MADQLPVVVEAQELTVPEIKARGQKLHAVMKACMKQAHHYGIIPGCGKPSLWKPGAEMICATFRLSPLIVREDKDETPDSIAWTVRLSLIASNGTAVGEAEGYCSSDEDKYRWRKAVCPAEFEATPEDRRRLKYNSKGETIPQVRTQHADIANTILKMAYKRALVAVTLVCTGASDIFTQDVEDMPQEIINPEGKSASAPSAKPSSAPKAPSAGSDTRWMANKYATAKCGVCAGTLAVGEKVLYQFSTKKVKCESCAREAHAAAEAAKYPTVKDTKKELDQALDRDDPAFSHPGDPDESPSDEDIDAGERDAQAEGM